MAETSMREYIQRMKYDFRGRRNAFKSTDQIEYTQKQKYGKDKTQCHRPYKG